MDTMTKCFAKWAARCDVLAAYLTVMPAGTLEMASFPDAEVSLQGSPLFLLLLVLVLAATYLYFLSFFALLLSHNLLAFSFS